MPQPATPASRPAAPTPANTPFPFWRCIGNVLLNDEPAEKCNGLINRTRDVAAQRRRLWRSSRAAIRSRAASNQFTAGGGYDRSRVGFVQSTELGYLNPDRSVTGVGAFGDGVTGGEVDGEPFDTRVDLDGLMQTWSVYATDTRVDRERVARHAVGPLQPHDGAQSRPHRSRRRAGLARRRPPLQPLQSRGRRDVQSRRRRSMSTRGYSEGSRAATSIELGCAEPGRAVQAAERDGRRSAARPGRHADGRSRRARLVSRHRTGAPVVFRADNRDDILFVLSEQTGFGYFRNFGETRRKGIELEREPPVRTLQRSAAATHSSTRPTKARRASTARATAPTTPQRREDAGSRARLKSCRATAFR